jgi:choline dehydrogenase
VDTFDYIVVGAGSAGCVLANRLTASGQHRVLLLEAGGEDSSFWIHVPLGYGRHFTNRQVNWLYQSEPEAECHGRSIIQPRGKVLGGSSSINGLLYVRGQAEDFDRWRQLGNAGWSFDDVLPYFRKAEDQARGADDWHGTDGPLAVSDMEPVPICDAFIAAAEQAGYRRNHDFNGAVQEGFGYYQLTARNGRRCSAAVGYLRPARRRPNLKVVSGALATRVLFEGRRAIGIDYLQGEETRTARASAEVILAGGAFNTPQLMQLSGLGPAALLQRHGIGVIADMPGVGADLQDHYHARTAYRCRQPVSVNDLLASKPRGLMAGLRYMLTRRGLLAMGAAYAGGFFRTDAAAATPDVQCHIMLFSGDSLSADRAAPREPRPCAHRIRRSAPAARDPAPLSVGAEGSRRDGGGLARVAANHRVSGARVLHRSRARARAGLRERRRSSGFRAPPRLDHLPPDLDLPHGR